VPEWHAESWAHFVEMEAVVLLVLRAASFLCPVFG
jgi:hypothetical protein